MSKIKGLFADPNQSTCCNESSKIDMEDVKEAAGIHDEWEINYRFGYGLKDTSHLRSVAPMATS